MMNNITQVARAMQEVLTLESKQAGRESGFIQREVKLDGASFIQTLVFSWMANPEASLEEMTQTAALLGVEISPQGLDQRFTPEAAACVKQVLEAAVKRLLHKEPSTLPILERFTGVYVHDSSIIVLPDELRAVWPSCGGDTSGAALKVQVRWELRSGQLEGPYLHAGREQDLNAEVQHLPMPKGSLRLADLGYWSVKRFDEIEGDGSYVLSRVHAATEIFSLSGEQLDFTEFLRSHKGDRFEMEIELSCSHRWPCRLMGQRVPPKVSAERRRKLWQTAHKKGMTPSRRQFAFCDWNLIVTNAPTHLLTLEEALVLLRVRWQIELCFKFWKSQGRVDESRSQKPYRVLCEVYTKLLILLIQHWVMLTNNWSPLQQSLFKAGKAVPKKAWHLASALHNLNNLCQVLTEIGRVLARSCRINKRKKRPSTFQRLHQPSMGALA
jgi:Transposase DDE domain